MNMNSSNSESSCSTSSDSDSGQFFLGLVLGAVGAFLSFILSAIPYAGPFIGLVMALGLGFGCGWIYGFWIKFFGSFGVLGGLFAALAFKFGVDKRTVILFIFQVILFSFGFFRAVITTKRQNRSDDLDKPEGELEAERGNPS